MKNTYAIMDWNGDVSEEGLTLEEAIEQYESFIEDDLVTEGDTIIDESTGETVAKIERDYRGVYVLRLREE